MYKLLKLIEVLMQVDCYFAIKIKCLSFEFNNGSPLLTKSVREICERIIELSSDLKPTFFLKRLTYLLTQQPAAGNIVLINKVCRVVAPLFDNKDFETKAILENSILNYDEVVTQRVVLPELAEVLLYEEPNRRSACLQLIGLNLAERGHFDDALAVAILKECRPFINDLLIAIDLERAKIGVPFTELTLIDEITSEEDQCKAYRKISNVYADRGKFEDAESIINKIKREPVKSACLEYLSISMSEWGRLEDAFRVAKLVDESECYIALVIASAALCKPQNIVDLSHLVGDHILYEASEYLAEINCISGAVLVAQKIRALTFRSIALENIAKRTKRAERKRVKELIPSIITKRKRSV